MAPNLPSNSQDDTWGQALFNNQPKSSPNSLPGTPNLAAPLETEIVNRASLIPADHKSKLPTAYSTHSLVPLVGLLLAFGLLGAGQYLIPNLHFTSSAPDDMTWNKAYSLISVPTNFLFSKSQETLGLVANKTLSALAVASVFPEAVVEAIDDAFGTLQTDTFDQPKALALGVVDGVGDLLNKPVINSNNQNGVVQSDGDFRIINQTAAVGSLAGGFGGVTTTIKIWVVKALDFVLYYVDLIGNNWYNFFFGSKEVIAPPAPVIDEATLRAQIKAEVLADLKGTLAEALKSAGGSQPVLIKDSGGQGVVVVPSSASTTNDSIKDQIKKLFSDPVLVDFDRTGQSGIITPVFSNTTGENYIFVLTPVKSN